MKTWKVAGINFDHMHMGDLLRLVHAHPNAEIVGIAFRKCLEETQPDVVILCPSTAQRAWSALGGGPLVRADYLNPVSNMKLDEYLETLAEA